MLLQLRYPSFSDSVIDNYPSLKSREWIAKDVEIFERVAEIVGKRRRWIQGSARRVPPALNPVLMPVLTLPMLAEMINGIYGQPVYIPTILELFRRFSRPFLKLGVSVVLRPRL
jgi:hypothetical protein